MLNKNLRSWKVLIDSVQQLPFADINFKSMLAGKSAQGQHNPTPMVWTV